MDLSDNIIITTDSFSPEGEIARFRASLENSGAIVSFTGIVRDLFGMEENTVTTLHLQHYPGFTEQQISAFAQTALDRFDIQNLLIIYKDKARWDAQNETKDEA